MAYSCTMSIILFCVFLLVKPSLHPNCHAQLVGWRTVVGRADSPCMQRVYVLVGEADKKHGSVQEKSRESVSKRK